ncbi:13654_t:CDS:1 [Dentiscutata erythropus]|uniref:13654_t:CDS:1 n=1 Tax=Dentiscutata erythropus TaxID=1348616 RepID=A0A9N8ZPU4_9GLOM|nr:13654_t:CDS:1 [Dentiscutata erythropus]
MYLVFLKPQFLRKVQFHLTIVILCLMSYIFIAVDLVTNGQQIVALILVHFAVANTIVETFGTSFAKPLYIVQLLLVFLSTALKYNYSSFGFWVTLTSPIILVPTFIFSARLAMFCFLSNENKLLIPLVSNYPDFTIFIISLSLFSNLSKREKMFIFNWTPHQVIRISKQNSAGSTNNRITCDPDDKDEHLREIVELREAILQIINNRFY